MIDDAASGLTFEGRIALARIRELAAAHAAWTGLKKTAAGEAPDDPEPMGLKDKLAWTATQSGTAAQLRCAYGGTDAGGDPAVFETAEAVAEAVRSSPLLQLEHRHTAWVVWDPDEPKLTGDEARILVMPTDGEAPDERLVGIEIHATPGLDGQLDPESAALAWRHGDELRRVLPPVTAGAAIRWTAGLFRIASAIPEGRLTAA